MHMAEIKFTSRAAEGERYAPGAFDRTVGSRVTMRFGARTEPATVIAAEVAADGLSVEFTLGVEDLPAELLLPADPT